MRCCNAECGHPQNGDKAQIKARSCHGIGPQQMQDSAIFQRCQIVVRRRGGGDFFFCFFVTWPLANVVHTTIIS
jgi:hypothetical protein